MIVLDLNLEDYKTTYDKQQEIVKKKKEIPSTEDYLLIVEHPEIYTFGRKFKDHLPPHLPNSIAIERGGEATYHNPGQLVAYPILKLNKGEQNIPWYMRTLEEVAILTLKEYGIESESRDKETGVWIKNEKKKIASLGVAITAWITYHGIALNVENDLLGFKKINPCGYSPDIMISMREILGTKCPQIGEVKKTFTSIFKTKFNRK